ncbi:hypothetical protein UA08_03028 [Talaromyces atroroseus]|uniref:Xylanolytic transcriptional activator regulatory domain-containing protein n=1 Tax=Talaromyces atroroseus TaxID=1441469 RepID=A0A225B3F1_TALAT|nr:hypothetical protein UA08_03028 [Talaromyces atroroseus]OKL61816.1 hypothetical protein UA08_03028 [Talaromyces atroroseus]
MAGNTSPDYKALFQQEIELRRQAEVQTDPTVFREFIQACHSLLSLPFKAGTPTKSTKGKIPPPTGKYCPTRLCLWSDCSAQQQGFYDDVNSYLQSTGSRLCAPLALSHARERFRLGNGIVFDNHANVLEDDGNNNNNVSSTPHSRPDQFCIHRVDSITNSLLTTVEYKPPQQLVGSVLTQEYHVMIQEGLEYSYITNGLCLILLRVPYDDPNTGSVYLPSSPLSAKQTRRASNRLRGDCAPMGTMSQSDRLDSSDSGADTTTKNRKLGIRQVLSSPPSQRRSTRPTDSTPPSSGQHQQHTSRFCTQRCLLGLQQGGALDRLCPNVHLHRHEKGDRHSIDAEELVQLLKEQLDQDLDHNCTPFGDCGSYGAPFKITCAKYGYTLIGKGTTSRLWKEVSREVEIYRILRKAQGSAVPVFIGAIDLKMVYFLHGAGEIQHMLLMAWGGGEEHAQRPGLGAAAGDLLVDETSPWTFGKGLRGASFSAPGWHYMAKQLPGSRGWSLDRAWIPRQLPCLLTPDNGCEYYECSSISVKVEKTVRSLSQQENSLCPSGKRFMPQLLECWQAVDASYQPAIPTLSTRQLQDQPSHFPPDNVDAENESLQGYEPVASVASVSTTSRHALNVQHIRSLDQIKDSTAQLFGISAESDPWLLRHCKYDENGIHSLHRIHFRNVGGVPVEGLVPVHFLVTDDLLFRPAKIATAIRSEANVEDLRHVLDELVPPKYGWRLILLFLKFVFPSVPVISRSQLGLNLPLPNRSLSSTPVHLLAAIYASALPFKAHDPELVIFGLYDDTLCDRLWRLVYEVILQEIHTPHLSVFQACLLYLQRLPLGSQSALADSPFVWSFLGSTVGLAASLGLHLEPRPWGIPAWEKRLRRRLWWAIYLEDKWRSLLIGRPPFIRREEWDVKDLDDADFVVDGLGDADMSAFFQHHLALEPEDGAIFKSLTDLAQVVDDIYQTFYTLRGSQRTSEDFQASINAARPIRQKLQAWYSSLPDFLRIKTPHQPELCCREGAGVLHFAYLTLELFVYRAILRPLARSPPPPPIIADDKSSESTMWLLEDLGFDGYGLDQLPAVDVSEFGEAAEATLNAAEKCAGIIVNFVGALEPRDFDMFWYPWTRICFATMTNFICLLLVQALTEQHASRTKHLLEIWTQNLSRQYRNHENLMALGLVRLHSLVTGGLGSNFIVPPQVAKVLDADIDCEDHR